MSVEINSVLESVTTKASAIEVLWIDTVIIDGQAQQPTRRRTTYIQIMKDLFLLQIPGGQTYIDEMGW